jgi:hypothetical protein
MDKYILIEPNGEETVVYATYYQDLQTIIGGKIDAIEISKSGNNFLLLFDELGIIKQLHRNRRIFKIFNVVLYGNVLVKIPEFQIKKQLDSELKFIRSDVKDEFSLDELNYLKEHMDKLSDLNLENF